MVDDALTLPMAVQSLLPHRPPMLLVDELIAFESGDGTVSAQVKMGDLFVDGDGQLENTALVELIAQSYAAIKGYEDTLNQVAVKQGYLVGSRKISFLKTVYAGDSLMIDITTSAILEGFSVIAGVVKRGDETVAEGSVKLWIP
ncbi:MAG: hypothetical protein J7K75_02820 [Desulfuromonas sp.]|nr:hypothetical protein [Desulfuromonas sp.]